MIVYTKYMILKLFNLQTSPSITKPSSNITKHHQTFKSLPIWLVCHLKGRPFLVPFPGFVMAGGAFRRAASHGSGTAQLIMGPGVKVWGPGYHRLWECFRGLVPSWLVVWNIVYFSIYMYMYMCIYIYIDIGKNNPNIANIFQRGWNHQPALVFWVP